VRWLLEYRAPAPRLVLLLEGELKVAATKVRLVIDVAMI
jgi:hypothetical protein